MSALPSDGQKMWVLVMALAVAVMALFLVVMNQSRRLDLMMLRGPGLGSPQGTMMRRDIPPAAMDRLFLKEDQEIYTDPGGRFAFVHPKGVYVSANTTTSTEGTVTGIILTSMPMSEGPVPDMHITVTDTYGQSVEFRTWENLDIPYYDELVSSFRLMK